MPGLPYRAAFTLSLTPRRFFLCRLTALQDPEQYKTGSDLEIKISANKDGSTLVIEYVQALHSAGCIPANSFYLVHHSTARRVTLPPSSPLSQGLWHRDDARGAAFFAGHDREVWHQKVYGGHEGQARCQLDWPGKAVYFVADCVMEWAFAWVVACKRSKPPRLKF